MMALLRAEVGSKCIEVQHIVQKDGHNVGYLPKEPKCNPQVSRMYTQPFVEVSDAFLTSIGG